MNDSLKDMLTALGALSEMSLHFYRTLIANGATKSEAATLTQAYIGATLYGDRKEKP